MTIFFKSSQRLFNVHKFCPCRHAADINIHNSHIVSETSPFCFPITVNFNTKLKSHRVSLSNLLLKLPFQRSLNFVICKICSSLIFISYTVRMSCLIALTHENNLYHKIRKIIQMGYIFKPLKY